MTNIPLTVVMPAYNEEHSIEQAVREILDHVMATVPDAELIVVDDGSRDRTGVILDNLQATNSHVRVIHQQNRGHGPSLRRGLEQAAGGFVFVLDSDRQVPLENFQKLWDAIQSRDAVLGVRSHRQDPTYRLILSSFMRTVVAWLFRTRLKDPNAPFKLIRRSVWSEARRFIPDDTLAPSLLLAIFVSWRNFDFVEVDITHRPRATGQTSIRHWRLLTFCAKGFVQLLAFRFKLRR